jgi:hypothetical protein
MTLLTSADSAACCSPLSAQPLTTAQAEQVAPLLKALAEQVAPLLKALADPVRLRLMSLVASHPGGEAVPELGCTTVSRVACTLRGPARPTAWWLAAGRVGEPVAW